MLQIFKGKMVNVDTLYKQYLVGKELLLGDIFGQYTLLGIVGEDMTNFCKYVWENSPFPKENYETLEDYIEEVNMGNDGFGFAYNEIELIEKLASIKDENVVLQ